MNCFSPTTRKTVVYGSTTVCVEQPLFPDQAYLLVTESDLAIARANNRVIGHRLIEPTELFRTLELIEAVEGTSAPLRKLRDSLADSVARPAIARAVL